jgi:hypothetical protein
MSPRVRLLTYLTCVHLALGAIAAHRVVAEGTERVGAFAQGALRWSATRGAFEHALVVNGTPVTVASRQSSASPLAVLDGARDDCRQRMRLQVERLWEAALAELPSPYRATPAPRTPAPMIARASKDGGFVACVGFGPGTQLTGETPTIPAEVRIIAARPSSTGAAIVEIHTQGPLRPESVAPDVGDAPHPPLAYPRPRGSRVLLHGADTSGRTLALFEAPPARAPASATSALEGHARLLRRHGYTTQPAIEAADGGAVMLASSPGGGAHLVSVDREARHWVVLQ